MPFEKTVFGNRLRMLMHENGDTVYTVAAYLGMKASTISRYTSGQYVPKAPTLEMLARRYHVNPPWLMGEDVPQHPQAEDDLGRPVPILGSVAAGTPIWAEENYEGLAMTDARERIDFALRVRGDSMTGARIHNGDLVFVRKQPEVQNGEIAVVLIENEATVKRLYRYPNMLVLRPENPAYTEMVFSGAEQKNISVLGKVIFMKGTVK